MLQEVFAELIQIDGLVIKLDIRVLERLLRNKIYDIMLIVYPHHRSVHPSLVFRYQRNVRMRILHYEGEHPVIQNKVRLYQQSIIFEQLVLGKCKRIDVVGLVIDRVFDILDIESAGITVTDMLHKVITLVSYHDDDSRQIQAAQLSQKPVDQSDSVDLHHAFGVIFGKFLQTLTHACGKNYCLHNYLFKKKAQHLTKTWNGTQTSEPVFILALRMPAAR